MTNRIALPALLLLALTGYSASSVTDDAMLPMPAAGSAGTWEDDCNLSKRSVTAVGARPGSPKSALWTSTTITYQDRACRQVAALGGFRLSAAA